MVKITTPFKTVTTSLTLSFSLLFSGSKPTDINWTVSDSEGQTEIGTDVQSPSFDFDAHLPQNLTKPFLYTINVTVTSNWEHDLSPIVRTRYPPTGEIIQNDSPGFIQEDYTYHASIYFKGRTQQPPTYLETLDKLDQYSKAQYISYYRR